MTLATKTLLFNAAPLFAVALAYAAVTATILPGVWRARRRATAADVTLITVFPTLAAAALLYAVIVVAQQKPLEGHLWVSFGALLAALAPAAFFFGRVATADAVSGSDRVRRAEARTSELDRELSVVVELSASLVHASSSEAIARTLIDKSVALVSTEFGALTEISDDLAEGVGVLARKAGADVEWYAGLRFDLRNETSGTASTVFEAAPLAIYDAGASPLVNKRLVERVGPQSLLFVPLIAEGRVLAVLTLASIAVPRSFSSEEIGLLQSLANESALALARLRSSAALAEALDRERLVSRIASKFRTQLDLDSILRVAVEETAHALGVDRAFVRLSKPAGEDFVAAEWRAEGLASIETYAARLPGANLAAREGRTVAVADIERAPELDDPELGDLDVLRQLGTRAVLATPITVFDETIGVFVLQRTRVGVWTEADVAVAEAVAREAGLALHIARLLGENAERLRQQTALLRAARQVTAELELETVLQRLVDEVAALLVVEAADLYLHDAERRTLRCAAVHGMPEELVGFEFSSDRGAAAEAMRLGAPVVSTDYDAISEPVPHPAYEGFTDVLVAPIVWSGETRGVLGVGTRNGERSFGGSDADVIGAFASLAALALRNAEAYEDRSRQARVQRGFYRVASVLGEPLSLSQTLDAVAQAASEALGGDSAAVLMPRRGGGLALVGTHELPNTLAEALRDRPPADVLALCAAEQRVIAAPELAADDRFDSEWKELTAAAGCDALLAVPLETPRDGGCGVVLVLFAERRRFTDDDLEVARHLAHAARGALERSDLFESERNARALAQQLARTGSLLATELDPDAVLDEVVQRAPALLGAEAGAVRVLEGDELVVTAASGEDADALVGHRSPASGWLAGDVWQAKRPVAISSVGGDSRYLEADPLLGAGYDAYLGVPLVGPEGTVHGVLSIYARHARTWRAEEIEALAALAGNTSAALSNAELYTSVALDRERSYAILANIADGIVAVDRDGDVVLWNAAAERITGVPAAEALGRTVPEVLQRSLESDGGQSGRLVSIERGNEEVWLSLTEAVMRDPAGAVAGRIFAFRDISTDRLVEEMKSEFVATVSHELRGPLTSIYGFAETLLREDVLFGDDERRTFLGYIASESERLTTIVDALLNVARLESGDLQVRIGSIDVRSVVTQVVESVEESTSNHHSFVLDLPDEPLTAQADRDKLRQILAVLVDNAVKFSPAGGTVSIAARRTSEDVQVTVEDEGIGIPQSEQERIFRKFYRSGDASSGTGLGLFIARGLVSAMGGRISVRSEEGKGSQFTFELPLTVGTVVREGV